MVRNSEKDPVSIKLPFECIRNISEFGIYYIVSFSMFCQIYKHLIKNYFLNRFQLKLKLNTNRQIKFELKKTLENYEYHFKMKLNCNQSN